MKKHLKITVYSTVVENDHGEILMIKRDEPELPEVHGKWELPAGKKEIDETPEQTVVRETLEETGYQIEAIVQLPEPFFSEWEYPDFHQSTQIICYLSKLAGGDHRETNDHHVSEIAWVNPNHLGKFETLPGVKEFIEQAIKL